MTNPTNNDPLSTEKTSSSIKRKLSDTGEEGESSYQRESSRAKFEELPLAPQLNDFLKHPDQYKPQEVWYTHVEDNPNQCVWSDTNGNDALTVAVKHGHYEAGRLLVETYKAPVNHLNNRGQSALSFATQRGYVDFTNLLIKNGADVNMNPNNNSTITSASSSHHPTTLPLIQAAHFGRTEIVRLLVEHGANVEKANAKETTALMRASQEGHVDIVKYFLECCNANVNRQNNERMTSLLLASQRGHHRVVDLLLKHGADTNHRTSVNSTALILASKREHRAVVKSLLQAGAELYMRDSRSRTAYTQAKRRGFNEIAEMCLPAVQVDFMKRVARVERYHEMVRMWTLLQQERAQIVNQNYSNYHQHHMPMTLHEYKVHITNSRTWTSSSSNATATATASSSHRDSSNSTSKLNSSSSPTTALFSAMTLPLPLVKIIAEYLPLEPLWDKRLLLLRRRIHIDTNKTLLCALDIIDDVLIDAGLLELCDECNLPTGPGEGFSSWSEWRSWCLRGMQKENQLKRGRISPISKAGLLHQQLCERSLHNFLKLLESSSALRQACICKMGIPSQLFSSIIKLHDIETLMRRESLHIKLDFEITARVLDLTSRLIQWRKRVRQEDLLPSRRRDDPNINLYFSETDSISDDEDTVHDNIFL